MRMIRMKRPALFGIVAAIAGIAACSKDSTSLGTTAPPPANGFNIVVDSGISGETLSVHSAIPVRVHVTQNGTAAPGQTVTFSPGTTNGSVSATTATTDAAGAASVIWTLGDTARLYTLVVSMTGVSTNVTETAVGGTASAMSKVSADSSAVVAGAALSIVARVSDKFGNGSPGIAVKWSASGGSLAAPTSTTGPGGNATVNFVTTSPGTYNVTASVAGIGSVTFKIVAL